MRKSPSFETLLFCKQINETSIKMLFLENFPLNLASIIVSNQKSMPRSKINNRDTKCFTRGKLGQYLMMEECACYRKVCEIPTYLFLSCRSFLCASSDFSSKVL